MLKILKSKNSGEKYKNTNGIYAIKNGIKNTGKSYCNFKKKPEWLKISVSNIGNKFFDLKTAANLDRISTVCEEAQCPNIRECWSHGTATIMLMGKICTRACKFCAVDTGNPKKFLDSNEPINIAKSIKKMNLKYVVLTSVNRDDLIDGGAEHYVKTIMAIKNLMPEIKIEVLTPDFNSNFNSIDKILNTKINVFAHNIETVKNLQNKVRDNRASYYQSLEVLKHAKLKRKIFTKTSLMLGLGESSKEILKTMDDLIKIKVDILTLGQYMQPTKYHLPVYKFISLDEFSFYKKEALLKGFSEVLSGPLIRSSYRADLLFKNCNNKIIN